MSSIVQSKLRPEKRGSFGSDQDLKAAVLRELHLLTQERKAQQETVLGRFFQCRELQMCSALLAKAVDQCSRWRSGRHLQPPGGALPPI
jgi:maltooligosyltrehalose synthase